MSEQYRLAKAFAIVGFKDDRLQEAIEHNFLENATNLSWVEDDSGIDPEVLFLYPHDDAETRAILDGIIETKFSRPNGYQILTKPQQPDYRTIRHTDLQYNITYLSVFTFYEAVNSQRSFSFGTVYVPKVLVILSETQLSELFKNCLRLIYQKIVVEGGGATYLNKSIASIVHYRLPLPGMTSELSLGFGDPLTVHTPSAKSLPKTGLSVYRLVQTLGAENTVKAYFSLLAQLQVTIYSADVDFLTESCEAMLAVFYPFEYCFLYSPIQTKRCLERFNTLENPTPFFIGICEPPEDVLAGVEDKIVSVNLDSKSIYLPAIAQNDINQVDRNLSNQLIGDLHSIIDSPEYIADQTTAEIDVARANSIEKRLRACFLLFNASMIGDYRQSLSAVRFHPQPCIFFDKAHFFGKRHAAYKSSKSVFLTNFVDVFLEQILKERKLPVREVDVFDEVCTLLSAFNAQKYSAKMIEAIADLLMKNDKLITTPGNTPPKASLPCSPNSRPNPMPLPDRAQIAVYLYGWPNESLPASGDSHDSAKLSRVSLKARRLTGSPRNHSTLTLVLEGDTEARAAIYAEYINHIFAKQIRKAKKLIFKLRTTIKTEKIEVRRRIPVVMSKFANDSTRKVVDEEQFEILAKIVRTLLVRESPFDENGIAAGLLPVLQNVQCEETNRFLYMTVQEFPVWQNEAFWVALACRHVADSVAARHESRTEPGLENEPCHSMEVLADVLELKQRGKSHTSSSLDAKMASIEETIARNWCIYYIDQVIRFLLDVNSCDEVQHRSKSNHTVEHHVSIVVEDFWKEANLPEGDLEQMKAGIVDRIEEQAVYIKESLRSARQHQSFFSRLSKRSNYAQLLS